MTDDVHVSICVCTYRREHVFVTLTSLSTLEIKDGWTVRVIVADNDVDPIAKAAITDHAAALNLNLTYLHAPAHNISVARNACLDEASGDYCLFIDDDEVVGPGWLGAMIAQARTSESAVVLGPVEAVYPDVTPDWIRAGDTHSTYPVFVKGDIQTGYTCNVLLNLAAPSIVGRRFDLGRGKSGGEDTHFFYGVFKDGGKITYAPSAVVREPVPVDRANFSWLARRKFRAGQTHGRLIVETVAPSLPRKLAILGITASKALFCAFAAVLNGYSRSRFNKNLLRGSLHLGAINGLFGGKEIVQYGQEENR
ncbi:glycosyltransferase family 2 protein [Asticcacaulis sp. 201]|uniref:glycosyltransferase n=1 Tax=Asticcacaulis sp. 201 TaxID=3028787 RepID=UPI0029165A11|nr:glycosyltransferase family 2 protein [Asticcacaulis sp. 201]MDV6331068.1 glycosyltransferase family 2 protein [Asticcacaulis sp. 201]